MLSARRRECEQPTQRPISPEFRVDLCTCPDARRARHVEAAFGKGAECAAVFDIAAQFEGEPRCLAAMRETHRRCLAPASMRQCAAVWTAYFFLGYAERQGIACAKVEAEGRERSAVAAEQRIERHA